MKKFIWISFLEGMLIILLVSFFAISVLGSTDTLVIAYDREMSNLYPGHSTGLADIMVNMLVYDGLVTNDDKGNIIPHLAKSWDVSEDGTIWTFHLRDDVYFHSGNKFTAWDVKKHFDNWKKAPTAVKIGTLDRTEVVDEYTIIFYLKNPNLVFLSMISQVEWGYGGIPEAVAVEKWGDDYGIVPESISGTGPFKISSWLRGDKIVLDRFEAYTWGSELYKNKGPAYIKGLVIRIMPEASARAAALEIGEVDMDISVSPQSASILKGISGVNIFTMPKICCNQIGFNMEYDICQEDNVRFAIAHAINQQEIVDAAWNGYAEVAVGFWHKDVEGSTPKDEIIKYQRDYNPEKSKALLDEAGWILKEDGWRYKNGRQLKLDLYVYSGIQEDIAVVVQEQCRQEGIKIEILSMEYAAVIAAVREGKHHMRYTDGTHSTADFAYWYVTDSIPYPNYLRWSDKEYDRLFNITYTTMDLDKRIKAFQDIEKRLLETQVLIPMPRHMWIVGYRDNVTIGKFHPIHGLFKLMDTKVE